MLRMASLNTLTTQKDGVASHLASYLVLLFFMMFFWFNAFIAGGFKANMSSWEVSMLRRHVAFKINSFLKHRELSGIICGFVFS